MHVLMHEEYCTNARLCEYVLIDSTATTSINFKLDLIHFLSPSRMENKKGIKSNLKLIDIGATEP